MDVVEDKACSMPGALFGAPLIVPTVSCKPGF